MTAVRKSTLTFKEQRKSQKRTQTVVYHAGVIIFALLMLYPVMWLVASSLKGASEIWTNVSSLIPNGLHLENYVQGWNGFGGITFATFYRNSFIHAGFGTLFTVVSSAIVAYGFARVRFIGRGILFSLMLVTLMLPPQVLMIPQYVIFSKLGWINTFLPLLLPRLGGDVFFIFMMV